MMWRRIASALCAATLFALLGSCGTDNEFPTDTPPEGEEPGTPRGIAAEPGPIDASITLSWDAVDDAQTYNLYFRTSPGVTPQNGTKISGVTSGFTHSQLTQGETYYYIVAAVNGDIEGAQTAEVSAIPKATIGLHVQEPAAGSIVHDNVPITVAVNSAAPLSSVVVSVGAVSAPLAFNAAIGLWQGTMPLSVFDSPTARTIRVTATDQQTRAAEASVIVRLDRAPVITIVSPAAQAVAGGQVQLSATCTDDFRTGCASLVVFINGFANSPLATGTASIDAAVSIASFPAGNIDLIFRATDSADQVTTVTRTIIRQ